MFQSPRSGQICSNDSRRLEIQIELKFQSPRSGQICSNKWALEELERLSFCFNPLDRVKFVQMYTITLW